MQYRITTLALALGASAARIPRTTCSFGLTATGEQSGQIGQLDDGQNRIGGKFPKGTYSITNGQIVDGQGRGCILTPPTSQFQCDVGATPTSGFSIGNNGELLHNGDHQFYACPATDEEYNLYTTPIAGQDKCVKVGLVADACFTKPSSTSQAPPATQTIVHVTTQQQVTTIHETLPAETITETKLITVTQQKECTVPSQPPTSTTQPPVETHPTTTQPPVETHPTTTQAPVETHPTTTQPPVETHPTTTQPPVETQPTPSSTKGSVEPPKPTGKGSCPTNLDSEYQYPHLIVPVNKDEPHRAYGTQYNGKITSSISTIFNFDIPPSYTGTCSLVFLFPQQSELETSSFTFKGDGGVVFKKLKDVATQNTTFESVGEIEKDLGVQTLTPGTKAVVSTFPCPSGQRISFEASATGNIDFEYFQDYNPSPIGAYITTC